MVELRQYNVYGAEFLIESNFPKLVSELDKDFGLFPSSGLPASGFGFVKRAENIPGLIPENAIVEYTDNYNTVFSFKGKKFIVNSKRSYLILIPAPGERTFFCYARSYSHQLFCTVRSLVKYVIVSLLEDKNIYYIHGAAVSKKGKVAVILAKSGFGKTRSLLSLSGRGFKLLTDDVVLFRGKNLNILPFVIRGSIDKGHVKDFPKLKDIAEKRGNEFIRKWNFWFIYLTDLFEVDGGNPKPSFLVNLQRWNSTKTQFKDADKEKALANLMASYREFGSGVYFKSGKSRADLFNFYSNLLEHVRIVNLYVGSDPGIFAEEFEKLFD